MKINRLLFLIFLASLLSLAGCLKEKPLEIQKPFTYDEQYYENLRAYKKTKHTLCFGWYAAYAPIAGSTGYKDPASWGERIMGLPDSMDIVSLWMGIPGNDPAKPGYAPVAYADMKHVQEKKGTRFVVPTIVRMNHVITLRDGTKYDLTQNRNDAGIAVYAQHLIDQVLDAGLDGVDLDYEPDGDWIQGNNFTKLVQYIGQYFGPKGKDPSKLLIIDFFSLVPPAATGEYADYFIRQAYSQGTGGIQTATNLQNYYNAVQNAVPPSKFIVTENFGDFAANGGTPFTEANGNTLSTDGSRMYSLEGMARWNPTQGRKAGFGAFYFDRDYYCL
ncbi:MAG TPA: glycoside hydrolase family 18, partial [Flavisolibacter sp.]|nr:glycoside hydrolase family 18 [Flavisolibacter sp.]